MSYIDINLIGSGAITMCRYVDDSERALALEEKALTNY